MPNRIVTVLVPINAYVSSELVDKRFHLVIGNPSGACLYVKGNSRVAIAAQYLTKSRVLTQGKFFSTRLYFLS
jgi:hypothetical protein